jgi:Bacterial toxin 33
MGIDPVGVDENNVHSHNRYAYGNNNPYRYVDPDGRAAQALLCVNPVACVGVAVTTVAMAYYGNKAMQDTNAILQNSADKGGDGAELLRGSSASSASPAGMPPEDDDKNSKENEPKNAKDFKKLSNGEIQKLKNNDVDIHELKGKGSSKYDLYKDKKGDVYQTLKYGKGEPRSTGINIKDLK